MIDAIGTQLADIEGELVEIRRLQRLHDSIHGRTRWGAQNRGRWINARSHRFYDWSDDA